MGSSLRRSTCDAPARLRSPFLPEKLRSHPLLRLLRRIRPCAAGIDPLRCLGGGPRFVAPPGVDPPPPPAACPAAFAPVQRALTRSAALEGVLASSLDVRCTRTSALALPPRKAPLTSPPAAAPPATRDPPPRPGGAPPPPAPPPPPRRSP